MGVGATPRDVALAVALGQGQALGQGVGATLAVALGEGPALGQGVGATLAVALGQGQAQGRGKPCPYSSCSASEERAA